QNHLKKEGKTFILEGQKILDIDEKTIKELSRKRNAARLLDTYEIDRVEMPPDTFVAEVSQPYYSPEYKIRIVQEQQDLHLKCNCINHTDKLCEHLHFSLLQLIRNGMFKLPFHPKKRHQIFLDKAKEYGLESTADLDDYFELQMDGSRCYITLKQNILPFSKPELAALKKDLIPDVALPASPLDKKKMEFILAQETYVGFYFRLMEAPLAKNGNMKSPVRPVDLKKRTKTMETPEEFRFITSLIQQNQYDETDRADDMNIIKNPLGLSF